jgi:hypothetical protein
MNTSGIRWRYAASGSRRTSRGGLAASLSQELSIKDAVKSGSDCRVGPAKIPLARFGHAR